MDGVGVGHGGDLHVDSLLLSHRLVERIDEVVEWGICLTAIDVPDRNGGRRLFFFGRVGTARAAVGQQDTCQQKRRNSSYLHIASPRFHYIC